VATLLSSIRKALTEFVGSFEPSCYTGDDAAKLVAEFAEIERAAAAGKLMSARRAEETRVHEREGHKSAGRWLASVTGEPVGEALADLEAARSIGSHSEVQEAFRSGRLSEAQARQIASAAEHRPEEAGRLVRAASDLDFSELKKRCRDIRFESESAAQECERHERIRRSRYLRIWTDSVGAGHLEARMAPDAIGLVKASLESAAKAVFETARVEGRRESHDAYMADALVALASGASSSTAASRKREGRSGTDTADRRRPLVRIRVDLSALKRGHRVAGETCQIPGVDSPLPVKAVKELLGDSLLELVVTEGKDVRAVVTESRYISRALRIALEERDQVCCVPGCTDSGHLEADHWETEFNKGGKTSLENLALLCSYHHDQKTYRGWRIEGPPGQWRFIGPDGTESNCRTAGAPPKGTGPPDHPRLL
jgi:Domain of unknown function (DUF222)